MRNGPYLAFPVNAHRNAWLDVLRSLAIILVLLRHGSGIDAGGIREGVAASLFRNGWVGVDLFFVLSGYLITAGLLRRSSAEPRRFVPSRYFIDRILRIVPSYYAVLVLCVIGFFPGFMAAAPDLGKSFVAHLLFLQDYTGADINVVFWSLGLEEKFYILAPLLVIVLVRLRSFVSFAAFAAFLLLISPVSRGIAFEGLNADVTYSEFFQYLRSPFHMSLEGFVFGIIVALLQSRGIVLSARRASQGLGVGLIALVIWICSHEFLAHITRFDAWLQPTALAALFAWIVWCAVALGDRRPACEPFFRVNARLSYSLYLVHFPLLPLATSLGQDEGPAVFWFCYLGLSYVAALAVHFGVEKAFMQLKPGQPGPRPVPSAFPKTEAMPS